MLFLQKPRNSNLMFKAQKGQNIINGTHAAELFYKWILKSQKSKQQVIPMFDVAILFTG